MANYLQTNSLQEALQDPAADVNSCLKWKIMELSSQLQTQFLVKKLDKFLQAYKAKHRFERASFEDFCLEWQKESGIDLVSLVREWYQAKGVPCYWVRDVKHERTVDDAGRELVLSSFKVWNRSNRNGVIYLEARLSNQKMFLIPANSAREIRMVSRRNEYNYFNNISLRFGLSHNFPEIQTFTLSENLPQGHLYEEGCFEIDTTAFTPDPQEIIVEDNSESFRINNESTLKKMVQGEQQLQLKTMLHYPGTWTPFFHGSAHGDGEKTYYLKLWEAGGKDVEWQAELPEAGEYELFVFTNYDFYDKVWYAIPAGPDSPKLKEYQTRAQKNAYAQTYLVSHENGNEEVIIEMDRNGDGWVSLGKYRFPKGANKLTLIDKGAYVGQYLYADAVKWVRTK